MCGMSPTVTQPLFPWREEYETGIAEIDRQHRQLVRILEDLHTAMSQNKGREVLGNTLRHLAVYTATHFRTEEGLMQRENFPGLADHQRKHRKLMAEITNVQNNWDSGKLSITPETLSFLWRWLQNHILEDDMAYARTTEPKPKP